jgi:16S rRNA (cytosine1402-N4)-methyltransferase
MPSGANRFLSFGNRSEPSTEDVLILFARQCSAFRRTPAAVTNRLPIPVASGCDMSVTMTSPEPARAEGRSRHRPVLLREVVRALQLTPGLAVVDGTVGAGGHSAAILPPIRPAGRIIGLDRDPMMLALASQRIDGDDVQLVQSSYADLRRVLDDLHLARVDRILLDLGLSSDQLADRERGFSFDADGPLDLRFDTRSGTPAAQWLADASPSKMAATFREFGEEPFADRIAQAIGAARKTNPIETAAELSALILKAVPHNARRGTAHPATRVFQTLRIVVNDELGHLDRMLRTTLPSCLVSGGIAAIISFHSLEDRMVKNAFRDEELWVQPVAKALAPTPSEVRFNPRSRSAKLRVARRR